MYRIVVKATPRRGKASRKGGVTGMYGRAPDPDGFERCLALQILKLRTHRRHPCPCCPVRPPPEAPVSWPRPSRLAGAPGSRPAMTLIAFREAAKAQRAAALGTAGCKVPGRYGCGMHTDLHGAKSTSWHPNRGVMLRSR